MGWLSGWQYRREIEIQQAYLDNDLYDFPLYVPITPSGVGQGMAGKCKDGGADLRFTQADGETLLAFEIERFEKASGNVTADIWVKVPQIKSSGSATKIYLYYGNPEASDGQDKTQVWSNNYAAVWHLSEPVGTLYDSTANANDGTPYQGVGQGTVGKLNGACYFDGSDDYIHVADSSSLRMYDNFTVSGWFRVANYYDWRILISRWDTHPRNFWVGVSTTSGELRFYQTSADGQHYYAGSPGAVGQNVWRFGTAVKREAQLEVWLDGQLVGTGTGIAGQAQVSSVTHIGHNSGAPVGAQHWYGDIDEVRISNVARPAHWIKFEYRNQSETDNELTWGSEEQSGPPPTTRIPWHLFFAGMNM